MGLAGVMKRERKDPVFASLAHELYLYFSSRDFPKVLEFCVFLQVCQGFCGWAWFTTKGNLLEERKKYTGRRK